MTDPLVKVWRMMSRPEQEAIYRQLIGRVPDADDKAIVERLVASLAAAMGRR